jgi:hypothetical protein
MSRPNAPEIVSLLLSVRPGSDSAAEGFAGPRIQNQAIRRQSACGRRAGLESAEFSRLPRRIRTDRVNCARRVFGITAGTEFLASPPEDKR